MLKGLLYLIGLIFLMLIVMGNTVALSIFFGLILILAIGNAIIEKIKGKKSN